MTSECDSFWFLWYHQIVKHDHGNCSIYGWLSYVSKLAFLGNGSTKSSLSRCCSDKPTMRRWFSHEHIQFHRLVSHENLQFYSRCFIAFLQIWHFHVAGTSPSIGGKTSRHLSSHRCGWRWKGGPEHGELRKSWKFSATLEVYSWEHLKIVDLSGKSSMNGSSPMGKSSSTGFCISMYDYQRVRRIKGTNGSLLKLGCWHPLSNCRSFWWKVALLWLVQSLELIFFHSVGNTHPNWRTQLFQTC